MYSIHPSRSNCAAYTSLDTFVTTTGLSNFIYILNGMSSGSSSSSSRYISSYYVSSLPSGCQMDDYGYYQAIGCSSDGYFTLDQFQDSACSIRLKTLDKLKKLNELLREKTVCRKTSKEILSYLLTASDTCSTIDHKLCSKAYGKKWKQPKWRRYRFTTAEERTQLACLLLACSGVLICLIVIRNRSNRYELGHIRRQQRKKAVRNENDMVVGKRRHFRLVFHDEPPIYT